MKSRTKLVYIIIILLFINYFLSLIKDVERENVLNSISNNLYKVSNGNDNISKRRALAYIKMIKCASSTIAVMLTRYAFKYKLDLMTPIRNRLYIGWPYQPEPSYILPSLNNHYDIACRHVVFNRSFFDRYMGKGVFYVTSLRRPFSQFKSMINYYNILLIASVPQEPDQVPNDVNFLI